MAYIPAVVLAVGIAVGSLYEDPNRLIRIEASDKTIHAVLYALLAISLMAAMCYNRLTRWSQGIIAGVAIVLYGGLMELLQAYCTRTRSGDWMDVLADLIGVVGGALIVYTIQRHSQRRKN